MKMSVEDRTVTNGKFCIVISAPMLDKMDAWDNLDLIKKLHLRKLRLYVNIQAENDPDKLKGFAELITDVEFELQDAWGFKRSADHHKFWDTPKCLCPKIDNNDSYPFGYYTVTSSCPLHGFKL